MALEIPVLDNYKAGKNKPAVIQVGDKRTYTLVDKDWTVLDLLYDKKKGEGKEARVTVNADGSLNFDQTTR